MPSNLHEELNKIRAAGIALPRHPVRAAEAAREMQQMVSTPGDLQKSLGTLESYGRSSGGSGAVANIEANNRALQSAMGASRRISSMRKTAEATSDIALAIPRFYDPLEYWDLSGLPWNMADEGHRHKLHKWLRLYYATHRLVPSLIDIFTRYPLIDLRLECPDKKVNEFYEDLFLGQLDYQSFLVGLGREHWLIGEAFALGSFNEALGVWEREELLNPEDIVIENFPLLGAKQMKVVCPEYLKRLATSKSPPEQYKQLEQNFPDLIPYLKRGEPFPVSSVLLKQVAFKITDWDDHGTPIMLRGLRTLLHEEKLLASQDAIAERLYSPLILARLGIENMGDDIGPWIPDPGQLEAFRDDMDMALAADFRLMVYHYGLQIENVFGREQVPNLGADFDRVSLWLMQIFGLQGILGSGAAQSPYATSALNAEFMNQILTTYQHQLKRHMMDRMSVVAEAQGHFAYDKRGPQPLDAKVLTSIGWKLMGDIKVGDQVIGSDGHSASVVEVIDQGVQDVYRVTFSDRSSTECAANHNWAVISHGSRTDKVKTMTLQEIMDGGYVYDCSKGLRRYKVLHVEPVEFANGASLPVDPYLLGLLIGDGCLGLGNGTVSLASHIDDCQELVGIVANMLPVGVTAKVKSDSPSAPAGHKGATIRLSGPSGGGFRNQLNKCLRELGLWHLDHSSKFVPEKYLRANITDRVAILQGLLDSDGSTYSDVNGGRRTVFSTDNPQLAADVQDLVGSLGGSATLRHKSRSDELEVYIKRLPEHIIPHRLSRKVERYRTLQISRPGRYRHIAKIEKTGIKPVRCITVDSADHLYITDDYIVTHNSTRVPIMEEVVEWDENGDPHIVEKHKLLVPSVEMATLDVRDEVTQRQFVMGLRAAGVPIPDNKLMMGVEWKFEDLLDEYYEETIQKTVAQQMAKLTTYKILRAQGLSIPPGLQAEIEGAPPGGGPGAPGGPEGGGGPMGGPGGSPGGMPGMGMGGPGMGGTVMPGAPPGIGGGMPPAGMAGAPLQPTPGGPRGAMPNISTERMMGMPRPASLTKWAKTAGYEDSDLDILDTMSDDDIDREITSMQQIISDMEFQKRMKKSNFERKYETDDIMSLKVSATEKIVLDKVPPRLRQHLSELSLSI